MHTHTHSLFVDNYYFSIKQFTCSLKSIILSSGQFQTLHIYCPSSPSALDCLVPAPPKLLITEKAKHEGPSAAAVPISPHQQPPGLTHRPLCLLLSFGNSCAVITECVPRLNSCFLLLQRQSDTPSPETHRHNHTHMLAHMYIHSMYKQC